MKYFTNKLDSLTFCAEKLKWNMRLDLLELDKKIGLSRWLCEKSFVSLQYASLPTSDKNLTCNKKEEDGVTKCEIKQ